MSNGSDGSSIMSINSHSSEISCIQFDWNKIISGGLDGALKVTCPLTGACLSTGNHNGPLASVQIGSEGKFILSSSWDKTVSVWFTSKSEEVASSNSDNTISSNVDWTVSVSDTPHVKAFKQKTK